MKREDALKNTVFGMIVLREQVEKTINEVYDDFEVEKSKLKNKIIKLEQNLRHLGAIK